MWFPRDVTIRKQSHCLHPERHGEGLIPELWLSHSDRKIRKKR